MISRDISKMEIQSRDLKSIHKNEIKYLSADLGTEEGIAASEDAIQNLGQGIEVLINNAGFGINSDFMESSSDIQARLINCMVTAPMRLTHMAATNMKANKVGYIVNISSVASFMAGSTYCSAKAWLTVFTESISDEFRNLGINVHVICPGFTRTEFHSRCSQDVSGVPNFVWLDSEDICNTSWRAVKSGKLISIPGLQYKILVWVHRYAPRKIVRIYGKIAKSFLRRGGRNG